MIVEKQSLSGMNCCYLALFLMFSSSIWADGPIKDPILLKTQPGVDILVDTPQYQAKNPFLVNGQIIRSRVPAAKTKEWGSKYDGVKALFNQVTSDRVKLAQLRAKYIARYKDEAASECPHFAPIMKDISRETVDYINDIIAETIKKIGPAPTPYCLFSLGSLARHESGFFTDLEIGILVDQKSAKAIAYFNKFSQELADRIFLLGEHPLVGGKGMRLDEADNGPFHNKFFMRYASPAQTKSLMREALEKRHFETIPTEGSRLYLATPDEFASHLRPDYLDSLLSDAHKNYIRVEREKLFESEFQKALIDPANAGCKRSEIATKVGALVQQIFQPYSSRERQISSSIANGSRNIRFLFGDQAIFERYRESRDAVLNGMPQYKTPRYTTRRQEIAYMKMREDIANYLQKGDKSSIVQGALQDELDIKRELYRFPEQLLTNLGFWHNCKEQNTIEIANQLAADGIIQESFKNRLVDLMNFCMGMRLNKQDKMRKQGWATPTTLEEYQSQEKKLSTELANLRSARALLERTYATQSDLAAIDQKIIKADGSLRDLKKMKPLSLNSILGEKEIKLLNDKYLPFLKELFEAEKSFLEGNAQAFAQLK